MSNEDEMPNEDEIDHHADDHDVTNCNQCERNWYDRTSGEGAY